MSATTVIVISVIITILVLWASVWVVVKGYAYKHTVDSDDTDVHNNVDGKSSHHSYQDNKA